jgi:ADP-heptose:LPS heptosyltransferase
MLPPKSKIWLSVQKDKHPLYDNNKDIDRLYSMPLRFDILLKADYLIEFSEKDDIQDFKRLHMSDYYLNFMKIDYMSIKNKQPKIEWGNKRSSKITSLFEEVKKRNPDKPLFLLNWKSSNRLRDIPPEKLLFLTEIYKKDIIFVVAQQSNLSKDVDKLMGDGRKNVVNCTSKMDALEDYISAIANCDAMITTDTATGHLAEALGKPSMVIYGPTFDDNWIRYYENTYPLRAKYTGKTCCSPCGLTKNTEQGCPESVLLGTPYSPCLLHISQERILSKFSQILIHVTRTKEFGL